MKFKYVYGPVPSRRLGRSLGVNPIPFKTCNYSCIYCQLGRTDHFINERRDFFSKEEILSEIKQAIKIHKEDIDYITFVGEGEPTLCKSLGWLIKEVKKITSLPVAVITNGALLYREDVREELLPAEVVMPSLDTAKEHTFRRLNRPHRDLDIKSIIQGMIQFRNIFIGRFWVEIMLVRGINDTEKELLALKEALEKIKPDRIYINVPIRPPAEKWVEIPDEEALVRAHSILGDVFIVANKEEGRFDTRGFSNLEDAIISITRRHPMRRSQIRDILQRYGEENFEEIMDRLIKEGKLKEIKYRNDTFYIVSEARMGERKR
ncbi:MAG TPA: radical SAM protein [candidate division WOR-3 bacterium]|uniref:Radical SAM protein n=2 Tax=candidate division WOR-3 bacterium TaxID=2052148 RepID=A0A7V5HNL5_UNCW3|nr:radical SAM protein [candidate division WOR-3 bacterium]